MNWIKFLLQGAYLLGAGGGVGWGGEEDGLLFRPASSTKFSPAYPSLDLPMRNFLKT